MPNNQRTHAERMLARAKRRHAQAERLVVKWTKRLGELDRADTAQVQTQLWNEEDNLPEPEDNS